MNRRDLTALGLAVTLFAAIRPPLFETPWGGSGSSSRTATRRA
jgi:hypothetical protein